MAETFAFKAELQQLLHIIAHSLYTHREVFLRELISNASDAIHKVRFDALSHAEQLEGDTDWKIRIVPDAAAGTLTVADNGIGMSRQEVIEQLGTVAQSGTKAFLEAMRQAGKGTEAAGLIGQFGVGFYSAFMVAERVTVVSRRLGLPPQEAVRWESDGQGTFTVEACDKPQRGTEVILHLKEDAREFLEPERLRTIVRKFSDFLEFPVVLVTPASGGGPPQEEILNRRKAIWLRRKNEVTPEEYAEFYKALTHDTEPPAEIIHYTAEGKNEFKVLAFIPAKKPFGYDWREPKCGLRLYIQRVLIMDRCDKVLPFYLRFVEGVVDCPDLPLNVSRELIQQHPLLETIQKSIVKSVLDTLAWMKSSAAEKYVTFYKNFGSILKEGLIADWSNREKIADLLLYESAAHEPGKLVSLAEYVEKMPADQPAIYYLCGESADALRHTPYLEALRAKGYDVLLMADPIDAWAVQHLNSYRGKPLRAADQADAASGETILPETQERFRPLLEFAKAKLPEVRDVRLTKRLTDSAACLVSEGFGPNAFLKRLLDRMGQESPPLVRVLELNPLHPAVEAVRSLHERRPDDPRLEAYLRLLYEQALIAEGSRLSDPVAFARRINELIARDVEHADAARPEQARSATT